MEGSPNRIQYPMQMRWIKQARRAAPPVKPICESAGKGIREVHAGPRIKIVVPFNLRTDRTDVRREARGRHHTRMKVAVGTFRLAKGDLNVNPEARHHRKTLAHPLVARTSRGI